MVEESRTVTQLHQQVKSALSTQVGTVWVVGEISSLKRSGGHIYAEIVERSEDKRQVLGLLNIVILAPQMRTIQHRLHQVPGVTLETGTPVRVRGQVDIYAPRGSMSLKVEDIDPAWTLGQLVADKDAVLRKISAEGLLEKQKRLYLNPLPLKVAVITSVGSAAEADFIDELHKSKIDFQVLVVDSQVQGADAPRQIIQALKRVAAMKSWSPDVVVMIRGGGSKNDLSTYDDEIIARTIAGAPWPILTGIGHEIDRSIADEVAHAAFKTPTAVAGGLIRKVRDYHANLEATLQNTSQSVLARLNVTFNSLARDQVRSVSAAVKSLERRDFQLQNRQQALESRAQAQLLKALGALERSQERIHQSVEENFKTRERFLERAQIILNGADPLRALARGFSISRVNGKAIKSTTDAPAGSVVEIQLADGDVTATVS